MQPLTSRVGLGAGRGLHAVPLLGRRQLWLPCSGTDPPSPRSLRVNGRKGTGGIEIFFQAAPLIFRHLSNLGKIHLGFYCKPQRLMLTGCFRAASNTFQKVSVKLSGGWVLSPPPQDLCPRWLSPSLPQSVPLCWSSKADLLLPGQPVQVIHQTWPGRSQVLGFQVGCRVMNRV